MSTDTPTTEDVRQAYGWSGEGIDFERPPMGDRCQIHGTANDRYGCRQCREEPDRAILAAMLHTHSMTNYATFGPVAGCLACEKEGTRHA